MANTDLIKVSAKRPHTDEHHSVRYERHPLCLVFLFLKHIFCEALYIIPPRHFIITLQQF